MGVMKFWKGWLLQKTTLYGPWVQLPAQSRMVKIFISFIWIQLISAWGASVWGGNGVDLGVDLLLLPNGNLLLLGTTSSFSALGYDAVLYVLDFNGQVIETNIIEEEGWQFAQRFDISANGGITISGKELNASGNWD